MHDSPHQRYLDAQVQTATPQKLRLMLIEGALRFANQAAEAWQAEPTIEACEAIGRCRQIIVELEGTIRVAQWEHAERVKAIYQFVYRRLCEATLDYDKSHLEDVIRVLRSEQQTWAELCSQMPEAPARQPESNREITAPSTDGLTTAPSSLMFEA